MAVFRKAERKKAKLRLGLVGPAGSGKTYSALQVAFGIGGKIALIDTENGSGDLYSHLGDYDVCTLEAPYTVQKYLVAIEQAERLKYDIIIIDSLTHAWAGDGGLLDQQGKIADSSRNSYTAWRTVTPLHYKLIDAMLTSKSHIIATMRSKTEYALQEDERGKKVPVKIGMAPVQREGMDYEFSLVFDLDVKHNALASKDRTSLFDGQIFKLSMTTGEILKEWLESGADAPAPQTTHSETSRDPQDTSPAKSRKQAIYDGYVEICEEPNHAKNAILKVTGGRGSKEWAEEDMVNLELDLKRRQEQAKYEVPWPFKEPESMREVIPEIDEELADKVGIGPDKESSAPPKPFSEVEKLRVEVAAAFGEEGLGWTVAEREAWIKEKCKVEGLKALKKEALKKVLTHVRNEIKKKDALELKGVA
jgi:hypothetical protein